MAGTIWGIWRPGSEPGGQGCGACGGQGLSLGVRVMGHLEAGV